MRLGYSTNSIGDIPLLEALPILQGLGYSSLAITLDHHVLNPFGGSLPAELARWQAALARELAGLAMQDYQPAARPLLLHHPLEGPLAARYLTTLERRTGAHCVATPYSAEHLAELKLTLAAPALAAPALALALAANRLTDQLAEQVGPPLLQRPGLRQLLLAELEALP